jgi:hypothetical protein
VGHLIITQELFIKDSGIELCQSFTGKKKANLSLWHLNRRLDYL